MRLKDIEVGKVYAAVRYYRPDQHGRQVVEARDWRPAEWEKLWRDAYPVLVLEKPVLVGGYATPGVRVRLVDPQTGEHLRWEHNGELAADEAERAVSLLMPWDEWTDLYLGRMQAAEEEQARKREEFALRKAREREASAKRWMEERFADARRDIYDVMTIVNGPFGDGWEPRDEDVRALVERREPEGNPYLNEEDA